MKQNHLHSFQMYLREWDLSLLWLVVQFNTLGIGDQSSLTLSVSKGCLNTRPKVVIGGLAVDLTEGSILA